MLTKDVTALIKYGTVILVKIPVRGAENKMKGSCSENSVSPGLPDGCKHYTYGGMEDGKTDWYGFQRRSRPDYQAG